MLCFALMVLPLAYARASDSALSPIKEISEESWYYRWGDSPVDDQGVPLWVYDDAASPEWESVKDNPDFQKNPQKHQVVWLLTQLPEGNWQQPTLFIYGTSQSFEVYFDHCLIYRSGEFKPSAQSRYLSAKLHYIPLDSAIQKKDLFLRVYSEDAHPDRILRNTMLLGSQMDITRKIIRAGAEFLILGLLFMFVGSFSVFIYFRRRAQKPYPVIALGIFASCVGILYLAVSPISELFVQSAAILYYCRSIAFFSFPIGLYMFIEQISEGGDRFIRRLWQFHIFAVVALLLLDVIHALPMSKTGSFFGILLLFGISVGFYRIGKGRYHRGSESKALNIGVVILAVSGLHDVLAGFGVIPQWHAIFPWGVFAFILCLAYILESRFTQAQRSLEAYSKELEAKSRELEVSNEKLEEYSQTLEEKVEERTRQLRETQDQLIMREKMASLGNLVAGVTHEMNNPIGAIHSAADVANRGVRRLKNLLRTDGARYDEQELQQSINVLESNHRVIATASERIARIVESLRAFSRLDEATFQKVDLHESIDNALDLLHYELRDKIAVIRDYAEIPRIQGYASELNQALMHLLRNAVQAIADQGTIKVETTSDETQVTVKISDTGKGIPSEHLSRIFDPGFTTRGVGVGLGLSIVYRIIKRHQGDIKVESEVGKGTEVTITLPVE